jgi:hypothetical protein
MANAGNILVPIAFLSWAPFVMFLYKKFDKRLVPVIAYVAGWMFLPCAEYDLFMLKNTKPTVMGYGLLVGAWLYDRERLFNYSFKIVDIPMLLWCTAPFCSSVSNGLGVYDGLSATLYTSILWGIPYYVGRVYFTDADVLKTLAITIFIGGLIYVPFSWFELIMSPQLHRLTYGFHQHNFLQTLREDGGYRPMVYMTHGLMASMWMMLASLLGTWLYLTEALPKKILSVPSTMLIGILVLTFLMYQSMAAVFFFILGTGILYLGTKTKNSTLVIVLLIVPYLYIFTRTTGQWDGTNLSSYIEKKISPARAESLQFRFDNETILIDKALQAGPFGWGGYGRARVINEDGRDLSVTDGLWVITLGNQGMYGLFWLVLSVQLPTFLLLKKVKPEEWNSFDYAAPAAMAIFIGFTMVDNLLNAMVNPIYLIFAGGVTGLLTKDHEPSSMVREEDLDLFKDINMYMSRFLSDPGNKSSKFIT